MEDQTAAPAPATAAPAEPEPATTGRDSDNSTVTKQGDDEAHTFTAMDDTKLIELKAAGKTWKEIVAETKKSQSALKGRYKEIGPKANSGPGGEGGGNGAPDGKQKRKNSNAKAAETEKEKETDAEAAEKEKEKESDSKAAETEKEKGSDAKAAERKDESGAETAEKNAQPQTQKAANKGEKGKRDVHKPTETAIKVSKHFPFQQNPPPLFKPSRCVRSRSRSRSPKPLPMQACATIFIGNPLIVLD